MRCKQVKVGNGTREKIDMRVDVVKEGEKQVFKRPNEQHAEG